MDPIPFAGSSESAMLAIKQALASLPQAKVASETKNYLHATITSMVLRFVDDVEVYFDEPNQLIHFRSASRLGYSDLGANRAHMRKFTEAISRTQP